MNPVNRLGSIVDAIVSSDASLTAALVSPGWLDAGPPQADAAFPCVRVDGLTQDQGKRTSYDAFVKLWSQDLSAGFLDLVEQFATALQASPVLICQSYLHRPESALNCAVFPVTFYPA